MLRRYTKYVFVVLGVVLIAIVSFNHGKRDRKLLRGYEITPDLQAAGSVFARSKWMMLCQYGINQCWLNTEKDTIIVVADRKIVCMNSITGKTNVTSFFDMGHEAVVIVSDGISTPSLNTNYPSDKPSFSYIDKDLNGIPDGIYDKKTGKARRLKSIEWE